MEKESMKDTILQLAAMSGEVSERAVMSLHSTRKYLANLLWQLRRDNLILRYDEDGAVGYRLSQSGKRYLTETFPLRYGDYFGRGGITSKVRLDGVHRRRGLRMSEVNAMMFNLGVDLFPGCKPTFGARLAVESQSSQSAQPVYYTSFEIKAIGEETIKIAGSRVMGVLLCRDRAFLLYHTASGPLKWEAMTEYRTRTLLSLLLKMPVYSILLGESMDVALTLLESNGGTKRRYYMPSDEHQTDMHFASLDRSGEFILRFVALTDSSEQVQKQILRLGLPKDSTAPTPPHSAVNIAMDTLYACSFDLIPIHRFKLWRELHPTGTVFCFDFQCEPLQRYLGSTLDYKILDSAKTAERFGIPG